MKIGIISAMPIELGYVLNNISYEQKTIKLNTFFISKYKNIDLILVSSGVGKVNASVYTQILIDTFSPDIIINIGIAGGLNENLKPFDIVIGNSYSHHDVNPSQMKNLFPNTSIFKANKKLLNLFETKKIKGITGPIVSGEKFIANSEEKKHIIDTFNAVAVDMETSAIAHTCFINTVPFIAIRGISDLANDDADSSYETNEESVSNHVGRTLLSILDYENIDNLL